ncbi:MAG: bifunctional (p)ppGpp synthetase/guanosine-3',5'-bis(diphosphate) 3'-pyrophosphohydrolase, partial [Prevotella sp.]|nr:bifunctional (p)ppGpp synthetase/guanosine-3',5'-bis(diphosphate) 3'-pyrophosphohydrolase [Prevotella sp.]
MADLFTFTYEEKKKMAAQTAGILEEEIGLKGDAIQAVHLIPEIEEGHLSMEEVERQYGGQVVRILHGLNRIQQLYQKNPVIESENFRNLLLSFAEDMRVILIMIANRVNLMRQIRDTKDVSAKMEVSQEAAYLYAPLARKLGLYKLKSELEDLSLKYMEHDAYYLIKDKLNETKASHDAYIEAFIKPVEEKIRAAGIKCHIKG